MTTITPDGFDHGDPVNVSIGIAIVLVALGMLVALGSYVMLAFIALE